MRGATSLARAGIFAAALHASGGRLLAQHDMAAMDRASSLAPMARAGSGTSWLPDSAPMRMLMSQWGAWTTAFHASVFPQWVDQGTKRGATQLGMTDWEMASAARAAAGGVLELRLMTSVEPFVLGGSGYPELLQSGGTFQNAPLHDRQHPHQALMEAAANYARALAGPLRWTVYAAPVGEPALGPVAFMHRPSAEDDPFAPIGHHWQDAAHVSAGVATLGIETDAVRIEASAFNAREPDGTRLVVDYRDAALDSYAARLSWMASAHVVVSAWQGFEGAHDRAEPDERMHLYGASVLMEGRGPGGGRLSTAAVWGMIVHDHGPFSHALAHGDANASPHHASHSILLEATLDVGSRGALFARAERVAKNGADMGFSGGDLTTPYDVRTVAVGTSWRVATWRGGEMAVGARTAVNFVPETLLATYGTRTPTGYAAYLQLRPTRMGGHAH